MIANKNSIYFLRILLDFIFINLAFFLAAATAQSVEILLENDLMFGLALLLNITWFFSAKIFDLYDELNTRSFPIEILNVIKISIVQIVISVFFLFLIKEDLFTRFFISYYFFMLIVLVSLRHIVLTGITKYLKIKGLNIRHVVIVGSGDVGVNFYKTICKKYDTVYSFEGFLDNESKSIDNGIYLGRISELDSVLENRSIDDVVIALSNTEIDLIDDLIKICNRHAVRAHIIPDYFRFVSRKFRVTMFQDLPIISVRNEPLAEYHWQVIKRFFDIAASSLFILLVFSWLYPIIAIIQKITSPGPVFFIQERIGYRNNIFRCLKFRSMTQESSNNNSGFKATEVQDARITKFGQFLRKTNLDEIPQFINVFKGDMSIVGPRPAAISFNELYREYIDELKLRNIVKPGITGWAQVHGLRGDSPDLEENKRLIKRRFEHDLWYIENWTFWLDIQIILMTLWQMIKRDTKGY